MSKLTEVLSRTVADASPGSRPDVAALKLALLQLSESLLKLEIACVRATSMPKVQASKRIDTFAELEEALTKRAN